MKALENQLAGEREMFPKGTRSEAKTGELESFQRRACRSRGNDSHALGAGGAMCRASREEQKGETASATLSGVVSS